VRKTQSPALKDWLLAKVRQTSLSAVNCQKPEFHQSTKSPATSAVEMTLAEGKTSHVRTSCIVALGIVVSVGKYEEPVTAVSGAAQS
jgi:hypothetical protein